MIVQNSIKINKNAQFFEIIVRFLPSEYKIPYF